MIGLSFFVHCSQGMQSIQHTVFSICGEIPYDTLCGQFL
jgi:hypothetical protein